MNIRIRVDINTAAIQEVRQGKFDKRVLPALTMQVIKDSNYYCRQDQGTLIASSLIASRPEKGLVIWDTPYAKRVYYTGIPCLDVNPRASLMWFEEAKKARIDAWIALARKGMK